MSEKKTEIESTQKVLRVTQYVNESGSATAAKNAAVSHFNNFLDKNLSLGRRMSAVAGVVGHTIKSASTSVKGAENETGRFNEQKFLRNSSCEYCNAVKCPEQLPDLENCNYNSLLNFTTPQRYTKKDVYGKKHQNRCSFAWKCIGAAINQEIKDSKEQRKDKTYEKEIVILTSHNTRMRQKIFLNSAHRFKNCATVKVDVELQNIQSKISVTVLDPTLIIEGEDERSDGNTTFFAMENKGDTEHKFEKIDNTNWNSIVQQSLQESLQEYLQGINGSRKLCIYITRHGNGVHNSPTNIKEVDAYLTSLGKLQALKYGLQLGQHIKTSLDREKIKSSHVMFLASTLRRSQLTTILYRFAFCLVNQANLTVEPNSDYNFTTLEDELLKSNVDYVEKIGDPVVKIGNNMIREVQNKEFEESFIKKMKKIAPLFFKIKLDQETKRQKDTKEEERRQEEIVAKQARCGNNHKWNILDEQIQYCTVCGLSTQRL